MTPETIKPTKNKNDAVFKMNCPQTKTKARPFICVVNYYKSLWPCHVHFVAPLRELIGSKPFVWKKTEREGFQFDKSTDGIKLP